MARYRVAQNGPKYEIWKCGVDECFIAKFDDEWWARRTCELYNFTFGDSPQPKSVSEEQFSKLYKEVQALDMRLNDLIQSLRAALFTHQKP